MQDEAVLIDNLFYLAGRKDYSRAKKVDNGRLTPAELLGSLDQTKPIFVIDHQPRDYQALDEAGADIDFSGHTHDGQLFPGNLVTALIWDNSYGYQKEGGLHTFVTSGVGCLGSEYEGVHKKRNRLRHREVFRRGLAFHLFSSQNIILLHLNSQVNIEHLLGMGRALLLLPLLICDTFHTDSPDCVHPVSSPQWSPHEKFISLLNPVQATGIFSPTIPR